MKSPIALLSSLLNDIKRLSGAVGTDRDLVTISRRFKNEGYGFLTIALPSLDAALLQGLASGRFTCPDGFKRLPGGAIPRLFSGMFRDVFDSATGQLLEPTVRQSTAVKDLRQILCFMKKLPTPDSSFQRLDAETKGAFVECDRQVIEVLPDDKLDYIRRVMIHVLPTLKDFSVCRARHRHGPGSVYGGETPNQKWFSVCQAIALGGLDTDLYGLDEIGYTIRSLSEQSCIGPTHQPALNGPTSTRASRGIGRLVTVPKTSNSLRTITVECAVDQYLQQGVNMELRDAISECPVLSNSLSLTDQTRNQILAMEGSRTGMWATIDLSKASDLLGLSLVYAIFGRSRLWERMIDSRSPDCEIDGYQLRLRKYAGMGNATTFPVQSVCFAVLAIAADCYGRGVRPSRRNVIAASTRVRVFGDDIIVHKDSVHQVVAWLEDFGLKVNSAKSFWSGNFRESCGVDAYNGVNVTPLYLRVRPCESSYSASSVSSLVELSNHLWLNCYYETATALRHAVENSLGRELPLVSQRSEGLGWYTRQDASEAKFWSKRLHRPEIKTCVVRTRKRNDVLDGLPALVATLSTADNYQPGQDKILGVVNPVVVDQTPWRYKTYISWKRVAA